MGANALEAIRLLGRLRGLRRLRAEKGPGRVSGEDQTPICVIASVALSSLQLMTAEELAERWQVQKSHIYRLVREDKIPVVKLGRYYRFHPDEIAKWEAKS
jgi:excisionase family DNA binding protein